MSSLQTPERLLKAKSQSGFSLVELLMVLSIMAIGTSLATPSYHRWNSQHRLRQAVTDVHSQMMLARMTAMNRSAATRVTLAVSGGQVTIYVTDDGTGSLVMPATTFTAAVANAVGGPIVFSSLGIRISGTVGTSQNITLTNTSGLQYGLKVSPAGKTSWCTTAICV